MTYYTVFLTALFVAMVLVSGLMGLARRFHFVDVPDERKLHVGEIPRVGGIGMVLGSFAAVWLWMDVTPAIRMFLAGILVIAGFGLWDDRSDLDYRWKFFGQFLAVAIVVFGGGLLIGDLSFVGCHPLPYGLSVGLTVLFLLGMTNAMNLSDGLDGLAGGVSLLSLACVIALGFLGGATDLVLVGFAIMGGTMGFLRYNTHPALVFMGDTGSQFLGFSLGVLCIWLTQRANTAVAAELPLLIVGLPVVDTLTVMVRRVAQGVSPFKADRGHFHHKLLDLGFDHHEVVLSIYVVQALFVACAYFMRYESGYAVLGLYGIIFAALVIVFPLAHRFDWQLRSRDSGKASFLTRSIEYFRYNRWLEKLAYWVAGTMILFLLLGGSLLAQGVSPDIGYFSLAAVIVSWLFRHFRLPRWYVLKRLTIYTCAILVTHSLNTLLVGDLALYRPVFKYFFVILAVTMAIAVYNDEHGNFKLTPSDFLVMLILLMSAYLPAFRKAHLNSLVLQSVVLLYAVEFVLRRPGPCARMAWFSSLAGLSVMAISSLG